jgi:hypothetical protein
VWGSVPGLAGWVTTWAAKSETHFATAAAEVRWREKEAVGVVCWWRWRWWRKWYWWWKGGAVVEVVEVEELMVELVGVVKGVPARPYKTTAAPNCWV